MVKGEGFAVDASVLEGNASRYQGKAPEELDWSEKQRQTRAVAEYLAALDQAAKPNPNRKVPKVIGTVRHSIRWRERRYHPRLAGQEIAESRADVDDYRAVRSE